jgi:carbamoyl-phosphate synthase large subunit
MKDITILVTGCGSPGVYGMIKSLREVDERLIEIIGLDTDPLVANRFLLDKFHIPPHRETPEFIPFVLELSQKECVDLVYPVPTAELEMFAAAVPRFESIGLRVVISDLEGLTIANNKSKLFQYIESMGLPCTPEYHVVKSWDDFVSAVQQLGYPKMKVCIKPPVSTGSIGLRILDEKVNPLELLLHELPTSIYMRLEDLARILKSSQPFPEMVVMEYLPGEEYDVDVLAFKGSSLAVVPRKNEKMWYGMSLVSTAVEHQEIIELSRQIISGLGLSYVVSLSFKLDARGNVKLNEINPRIPGSIIAATIAGVNMPYLAIKLILGEEVVVPPTQWGTQMIRYWEELFLTPDGDILT